MIDLILRAGTQQAILDFLVARNLLDADGNPAEGFQYCWWAGSGKVMSKAAVPNPADPMGPPTTPATFLPGFVMLVRIHGQRAKSDKIDNPADNEQHSRSRIAQWIKNNGTPGKTGTINWYDVGGVRLYRYQDVADWLAANGLPGHEWAGGNTP